MHSPSFPVYIFTNLQFCAKVSSLFETLTEKDLQLGSFVQPQVHNDEMASIQPVQKF